jgi:hypothetical protein
MNRRSLLTLASLSLPLVVSGDILAQSESSCFRIDVDIYRKETEPPAQQFKMFFTDSKSIEVDSEERLVRILDINESKLIVAEKGRRVTFAIDLAEIDSMMRELNSLLSRNPNQNLAPQPVRQLGANRLSIENEHIVYEAIVGEGPFPELTTRYLEFVDWSKKLAAVFPPNEPPQIRLDLNAYLQEKHLLPLELKRKIKASRGRDELVAKLIVGTDANPANKQQADRLLSMIRDFKTVSATTFFQ